MNEYNCAQALKYSLTLKRNYNSSFRVSEERFLSEASLRREISTFSGVLI